MSVARQTKWGGLDTRERLRDAEIIAPLDAAVTHRVRRPMMAQKRRALTPHAGKNKTREAVAFTACGCIMTP